MYEPSSLENKPKKNYQINLRSVKQPLIIGTATTNIDMLSFKVSIAGFLHKKKLGINHVAPDSVIIKTRDARVSWHLLSR